MVGRNVHLLAPQDRNNVSSKIFLSELLEIGELVGPLFIRKTCSRHARGTDGRRNSTRPKYVQRLNLSQNARESITRQKARVMAM